MKVIIVGGGKTLYFLCRNFTSKGYIVIIVNKDEQESVALARQTPATVICGDGSDPRILKEAGAMGADALLAITPEDQDNLVICQTATIEFSIPRVIALANDPDNVEVFKQLGVSAFSTTHIVSSLIEQRAALEQITNLFPVGGGRVNVTEVSLSGNSQMVGHELKDIAMPANSLIAVVLRDGETIVPRGFNKLMTEDKLVLITLPENHGQVVKMFSDETD